MRNLTTKGIGWIIAGALICASAMSPDDIADMIGTLLIGMTLIAVYFIKQRFDPKGIGWFIGGGVLTAFTAETLFKGLFRYHRLGDDVSTIFMGLILACVCFFMFYRKNKQDIDYAMDEMDQGSYTDYEAEEDQPQEAGVVDIDVSTDTNSDEEVEFELD